MKEFFRKNFAIIFAFLIPIVFIIVLAASTYVPSVLLKTNYNFIYSICTDGAVYPYKCVDSAKNLYSVDNGSIVVKGTSENDVRIFLHDTQKNESKEITLAEAQTFKLNGLLTSDDGVTVSSDRQRNPEVFPFFGGGSTYGYYLTKGSSKKKLNLINDNDYYYYRNNFKFLGWVLPTRN